MKTKFPPSYNAERKLARGDGWNCKDYKEEYFLACDVINNLRKEIVALDEELKDAYSQMDGG